MDEGLLSSFKVGSRSGGAINIFHLLFADDTLIFCEANSEHLGHLCEVCFYALERFLV